MNYESVNQNVATLNSSRPTQNDTGTVKKRRVAGKGRASSLLLILPLLAFLVVFFWVPLITVLKTAVINTTVTVGFPTTTSVIGKWDGQLPVPKELDRAVIADVLKSDEDRIKFGDAVRQLNADYPGFRSLIANTQRAVSGQDVNSAPLLKDIDPRWGDIHYWNVLSRNSSVLTDTNLLSALDMQRNAEGTVEAMPEGLSENRVIIGRTFFISFMVAVICLAVGVPYAIIAARVTGWKRTLMLTMVLIPLWTSLLVRSASWVVVLQDNGIINNFLMSIGVISSPLSLIFNRTGVLLAMSQVLLPFMVLPVFAAVKAVPMNLLYAASSLGAKPHSVFFRVLLPLIMPGVVSGALLVFMAAIGYYITPALVGGPKDQMVSSIVAFYATGTADWGRAAALGLILLAVTIVLYIVYSRVSKSNPLTGE
ncbi:ABC transporter permease [Pseudomonas vlassakiae]|uniref:ABC transporter permease n=1 Tax=Pseudomonas vlassakiae TaxID=485888 RepID=A0A923GL68_9PSED|nr:ABC transporter permease [Pseudomonas vlassakiae]MBV4542796.1 ABC transporter permease [Pseudomonas vlassakiae]